MEKLIHKENIPRVQNSQVIDIWGEFLSFINNILDIGVSPTLDSDNLKRLKIINLQVLICSSLNFLYSIAYFLFNFTTLASIIFLCSFFCLLPLHLVHKKHYISAKIAFIVAENLSIFVSSLAFGKTSGFHIFFFAEMLIPFLFFNKKEKKYIIFSESIIILFYSILEFTNYSILFDYSISTGLLNLLGIINYISSGCLVLVLVFVMMDFSLTPELVLDEQKKLERLLHHQVEEKHLIEDSWSRALKLQDDILNSLPVDIMMVDFNGIVSRQNKFHENFLKNNLLFIEDFGTGTDYIANVHLIYKNCKIDFDELREKIFSVLEGNSLYQKLEFEYILDNSWYEIKISALRNDSTGGAILFHSNITEFKISEFNLKLERFSPSIMFSLDENGNIKDFDTFTQVFPNMSLHTKEARTIFNLGFSKKITEEILQAANQVLKTGNSHFIRFLDSETIKFEARMVLLESNEILVLLRIV